MKRLFLILQQLSGIPPVLIKELTRLSCARPQSKVASERNFRTWRWLSPSIIRQQAERTCLSLKTLSRLFGHSLDSADGTRSPASLLTVAAPVSKLHFGPPLNALAVSRSHERMQATT